MWNLTQVVQLTRLYWVSEGYGEGDLIHVMVYFGDFQITFNDTSIQEYFILLRKSSFLSQLIKAKLSCFLMSVKG